MSTTQLYVNIFLVLITLIAIVGMMLGRGTPDSHFANLVCTTVIVIVLSAGIVNLWLSVSQLDATAKQTAGRLVEIEKKVGVSPVQ